MGLVASLLLKGLLCFWNVLIPRTRWYIYIYIEQDGASGNGQRVCESTFTWERRHHAHTDNSGAVKCEAPKLSLRRRPPLSSSLIPVLMLHPQSLTKARHAHEHACLLLPDTHTYCFPLNTTYTHQSPYNTVAKK